MESTLAAIAGSTIAVFFLEHYISAIVQQTPAVRLHPGQTPACQALHSCPLVALSWTQEGDGLLSADAQGDVIMWRLTDAPDGSRQLTKAWIGGSSTVVQAQSILTAGANILSPSASACPGTKSVTIWWPEEVQQNNAESFPKDTEMPAMIAVAEQLRHPVGVVAAQWSPGSLQHGKSMKCSQSRHSAEMTKHVLIHLLMQIVNVCQLPAIVCSLCNRGLCTHGMYKPLQVLQGTAGKPPAGYVSGTYLNRPR